MLDFQVCCVVGCWVQCVVLCRVLLCGVVFRSVVLCCVALCCGVFALEGSGFEIHDEDVFLLPTHARVCVRCTHFTKITNAPERK